MKVAFEMAKKTKYPCYEVFAYANGYDIADYGLFQTEEEALDKLKAIKLYSKPNGRTVFEADVRKVDYIDGEYYFKSIMTKRLNHSTNKAEYIKY